MRWTIGVISVVLLGLLLRGALAVLGRSFVDSTLPAVLLVWLVTLTAVAAAWAMLMWMQR